MLRSSFGFVYFPLNWLEKNGFERSYSNTYTKKCKKKPHKKKKKTICCLRSYDPMEI